MEGSLEQDIAAFNFDQPKPIMIPDDTMKYLNKKNNSNIIIPISISSIILGIVVSFILLV